ncbi:MAG: polysaccharide biosynthesis C-terminal domain-containing protein [Oscillospiraceae bacterium]|nr:polysaccharide biosynthesis C-terminal domain-containing protein [Oscillospiraceae bacterium]
MGRKLPIFYNALLLTGVNLLLRLVSTSFQVHISGRIGAAGVGLLQLVMSVGGLAMTAGMAGIRTTTMYLTAEELGRRQPKNVTWVLSACFLYSILCSGAVASGLYFAAPWLAEHWIGDSRTVEAIRIFSAFLPLVCLSGCMTGYFTAANRIGTLAAVEILEQLCYMGVTMTALQFWAGSDPARACQAVVAGSGISACVTLLSLTALRLREHPQTGPKIPTARRLSQMALPLALADNAKSGINTLENLMVPKRLALYPVEMSPLATFGMVCGMVFPVIMFPAAILFALAELLIPELARCNAAGSARRIRYLARKSLRLALLYGCGCGGLIYLLADKLGMGLYHDAAVGHHLRRYSLLLPMLYCDAITDAMTKGLGQQKVCVRYNILTASMDVAFLFVLLPRYGMGGYFFSFLVTHLLNFGLSLRRLSKISGVKIPFSTPVLTVSAAAAAVLGAGFLHSPWGRTAAFGGLFFSLLTLFGVLSRADLLWLKGLIKKK